MSDVFQLYRFITYNLKNPYYPETPLRFGTLLSSNKPCVLFKDNVYLVGRGETNIETEIFDPTHSTWTIGPTLPEQAKDGGSLAVLQSKLFYSDGLNIYTLESDKWTHVVGIQNNKPKQTHFKLIVAILDVYSNEEKYCNFAKYK